LYGKNKYGLYSLKSKFAISTEALPLAYKDGFNQKLLLKIN